jgi:LacI family transcriptional regulator
VRRGAIGIKDVAEQAGVSLGTVSNVLNRPDSVSAHTRLRVLAVIERLGYVRSESARQLRAGHSRIIALLVLGMADRPTAVFCANDLLALGVLQALYAAGVRVPEDVALVGYDDIDFAAAAAVPLTSVRQPAYRIGRTAAELLIEETDEGGEGAAAHVHQKIVFQPELVVRASSLA